MFGKEIKENDKEDKKDNYHGIPGSPVFEYGCFFILVR
jgi:hypothetical protein